MQSFTPAFIALLWGMFLLAIIGFALITKWYVTKYNKRNRKLIPGNEVNANLKKMPIQAWAEAAGKLSMEKKQGISGIQSAHYSGKSPQPQSLPKDLFNLPNLNLNDQQKQELIERLLMQILDLNIGLQQLGIGPNHDIMGAIDDMYRIFHLLKNVAQIEKFNPDTIVDLIYYQMIYNKTRVLEPFNSKKEYATLYEMLVHHGFDDLYDNQNLKQIMRHRYRYAMEKLKTENHQYNEESISIKDLLKDRDKDWKFDPLKED